MARVRALQLAEVASDRYGLLLWTVAAATAVYFVALPISGDITTGLGWADSTARQDHFPSSLFNLAGFSRGIGYKLYIYVTEGVARVAVPDDPRLRVCLFNTMFILCGLAIIAGAYRAFLLKREEFSATLSWRDTLETIALGGLIFLPAVIWSWAQDTHFSVLLCVLGIGLVLSSSVRAQWSSGIVLALLFTIKGVTALDFLFVLGTAAATGERARIRRVVISAAVATAAIGLAYFTVLRPELDNLLQAAEFRLSYGWHRSIAAFVVQGIVFTSYNLSIPLALAALAVTIVHRPHAWRKNRMIAYASTVWLFALPGLFAQHQFFGYHYQQVTLSAWLCLAALFLARGGRWQDFFRLRAAGRAARIMVLAVCCIGIFMMGSSLWRPNVGWGGFYSTTVAEKNLDCIIQITQAVRSSILSLDPEAAEREGVLVLSWQTRYGLGLPVASRFFPPLPLYRDRDLVTPAGRDYLRQILAYGGPVVIADEPMLANRAVLAPLRARLETDYRQTMILAAPPCRGVEMWTRRSK